MIKMKFQEKFPGLTKGEERDTGEIKSPAMYSEIDIAKHCFDKTLIQEAIADFNNTPNVWINREVSHNAFRKLLQKLDMLK